MSDTYSVSYITNAMRGAPVIQGNAPGGLIAVLDQAGRIAPVLVLILALGRQARGACWATFATGP